MIVHVHVHVRVCGWWLATPRGRQTSTWALLPGMAAGPMHRAAAALLKRLVDRGAAQRLLDWAAPKLLAALLAALLLSQAYAAGDLTTRLPALAVVDPVVAVALGAITFGARLTATPAALVTVSVWRW